MSFEWVSWKTNDKYFGINFGKSEIIEDFSNWLFRDEQKEGMKFNLLISDRTSSVLSSVRCTNDCSHFCFWWKFFVKISHNIFRISNFTEQLIHSVGWRVFTCVVIKNSQNIPFFFVRCYLTPPSIDKHTQLDLCKKWSDKPDFLQSAPFCQVKNSIVRAKSPARYNNTHYAVNIRQAFKMTGIDYPSWQWGIPSRPFHVLSSLDVPVMNRSPSRLRRFGNAPN